MAVSCSADRQALGKITRDGIFLEELERDPARFLPDVTDDELDARRAAVVRIDLTRPMDEIRAELSKHPVRTRVMLTGPMVVARDIAHAKIKERLDAGGSMPRYLQDHCVYYAGPAKTPAGLRVRLVRTDDGRSDGQLRRRVPGGRRQHGDARQGQPVAAGDRGVPAARRLLPRIDRRAAARLALDNIKQVDVLEYPELGMEAVWKIDVVDFPAFIVVDDKGNDFFEQVKTEAATATSVSLASPSAGRIGGAAGTE